MCEPQVALQGMGMEMHMLSWFFYARPSCKAVAHGNLRQTACSRADGCSTKNAATFVSITCSTQMLLLRTGLQLYSTPTLSLQQLTVTCSTLRRLRAEL